MDFPSAIGTWFETVFRETIHWFFSLDYQEWFVVLIVGAIFGFLCMRGFGSSDRV